MRLNALISLSNHRRIRADYIWFELSIMSRKFSLDGEKRLFRTLQCPSIQVLGHLTRGLLVKPGHIITAGRPRGDASVGTRSWLIQTRWGSQHVAKSHDRKQLLRRLAAFHGNTLYTSWQKIYKLLPIGTDGRGGGNLKSSFLISTPIAYQSWTRSETLRSTDITGGGLKSTTFLSTPTLGD